MASQAFVQPSIFSRAVNRIKSIIESGLNWIFSLRHSAGSYRNNVRWAALLLFYIFSVITLYDSNGWAILVSGLINNQSINGIFDLIFKSILHPIVLRNLIAVIAPYLLVHTLAAIYLADIFEKDVKVAKRFLNEAAFAEDYMTIRIQAGRLRESDQDSPIVQISGPGYVTVELDSAAVLECPDGTLRVIGPTTGLPNGRAVIEDFERLRQCVDLRDIISHQDVTSRSRDGIVIKARDIQYSYSAYRGKYPLKSLACPYPFDEEAIKQMVKGVVIPVSSDRQPPKTPEWMRPLPGGLFVSVNIEFGNFISQRGLSEFFSSIGSPEEESLRQRAEKITREAHKLAGKNGSSAGVSPLKAGDFEYRPAMAEKLFGSITFKEIMRKKGLQVNWIGVGTWETPDEIIPENHLEAWKTSIENQKLGGEEQLTRLYKSSLGAKLIELINDLPINTYYRLAEKEQKNDDQVIEALLEEYIKYLNGIKRYFEDLGEKTPENINTALESINLLLYHDIGSDYFACTKTIPQPDQNIAGAICYTINVAFSTQPLPGYTPHPVMFDFQNNPQLEFVFKASALNAEIEPPNPQKAIMKIEDLYIHNQFQVLLLPGTSADVFIDIEQNGRRLKQLEIPLQA
jgi:hypothetical protein